MNTIEPTNNQPIVSNCVMVNNFTASIFCYMPVEIIDHICSYLDLRSILNTSETCRRLNVRIFRNLPLDQIKKIYSYKEYFFINKNIDFINNSNDLLVKYVDYLTEDPVTKNNAIRSIKASKSYGSQFALVNIMSEGCYRFNQVNELKFMNIPDVGKYPYTVFYHTNYYHECIIIINDSIYITNSDKNKINHIININNFSRREFSLSVDNVFMKDEFLIIPLYSRDTLIIKKDQDTYSCITPKSIPAIYKKTLIILKDASNQPYFILCLNDKVYQCDQQQLLAISTNSKNIDCNVKDITPEGLIVYKISSSENGKLILFYGKNSSNKKQIELHIQLNSEIIDKISFATSDTNFDINIAHKFICSPSGTSFALLDEYQPDTHIDTFCKAFLYKISDNKLNKIKLKSYHDDDACFSTISYETDDILTITANFNKTHILVCIASAYADDSNDININCIHRHDAQLMSFNQTKNMYAIYSRKPIAPQYRNGRFRDSIYSIKVYDIKNKIVTSEINCRNEVNQIVFSPNSQLVVTKERSSDGNGNTTTTLRAYRIMKKNNEGNLIFLKNAELIAKFATNGIISNFHFHISGFKIILSACAGIQILDLEKDLNLTEDLLRLH